MTWAEFRAACLLLAEERVGAALRAEVRAEDAQIAQSVDGLRRHGAG